MASSKKSYEVKNETNVNQGDANATLQPHPKSVLKPINPVVTNKCTLFFKRRFAIIAAVASVILLGLFGGFGYLLLKVTPHVRKENQTKLYEDYDDRYNNSVDMDPIHPNIILDPRESYGAYLRDKDKKGIITVPCITTKLCASDFLSKHTSTTTQINKSTTKFSKPTTRLVKHMKKRHSGEKKTEMENDPLCSERNTTTYIRNKPTPDIRSEQLLKLSQDKKYNLPNHEIMENVTEIILKGLVKDNIFDSINENITSHNYYEIRDEGPSDKIIMQTMQQFALFSRVLNIMRDKVDRVIKEYTDILSNLIKSKLWHKYDPKNKLSNSSLIIKNKTDAFEYSHEQSLKYKALVMTDIASTTHESDRLRNEIMKIRMVKMLNYTKSPFASQSENTSEGQTQLIKNKSNHTDNNMTITGQKPVLVQNVNRIEESKYDENKKNGTKFNETVQITSKTANLKNESYYKKNYEEMSTVTEVSQPSSDHINLHPHRYVKFLGQSGQPKSDFHNKLNIDDRIENYKKTNNINQFYTKSRIKNSFVKFIVREKSHL